MIRRAPPKTHAVTCHGAHCPLPTPDTQSHAVITPSPWVNVTYVSAVKLPMAPGTAPLRALDPRLTVLQGPAQGIGQFDTHRPRQEGHKAHKSAYVGDRGRCHTATGLPPPGPPPPLTHMSLVSADISGGRVPEN
jgi:hypothetical protein